MAAPERCMIFVVCVSWVRQPALEQGCGEHWWVPFALERAIMPTRGKVTVS